MQSQQGRSYIFVHGTDGPTYFPIAATVLHFALAVTILHIFGQPDGPTFFTGSDSTLVDLNGPGLSTFSAHEDLTFVPI